MMSSDEKTLEADAEALMKYPKANLIFKIAAEPSFELKTPSKSVLQAGQRSRRNVDQPKLSDPKSIFAEVTTKDEAQITLEQLKLEY